MHEDDQVTQADLGLVHLLNGDLDRASQALMNSRTLDPAGARSAFLLGLVRLGSSGPTKPGRCSSRCPRRIRSTPRPAVSCRACAAKSSCRR